jgi:hypothetical protein
VAQRVNVILVCDRPNQGHDENNPGEDVTTVQFSLDGKAVEAELCGPDAAHLRDFMAEYMESARSVGRAGQPAVPRRPRPDRQKSVDVRAWARQQGIKVNERGRVPTEIVRKFEDAHP